MIIIDRFITEKQFCVFSAYLSVPHRSTEVYEK